MRPAIVWLVSAAWTALSLALEVSGLVPRVPWAALALVGFVVFVAATYVTLTKLEALLLARPRVRLDILAVPGNSRTIPMLERQPGGRLAHTQDGFLRLFTVHATSFVKNCTVRVNDLRHHGYTCDGFVPTPLRWYGADGPGSELRSFQGRDFVLFLYRQPAETWWELQAPVRGGTGVRLRYEPGDYEVDLIVLAENVPPHPPITGTLRVGENPDDVTLGLAGGAA
ncbi:MAG: hypothetical protein ACREJV_05840 [Candidatus Rokuibacteriota bacterium]